MKGPAHGECVLGDDGQWRIHLHWRLARVGEEVPEKGGRFDGCLGLVTWWVHRCELAGGRIQCERLVKQWRDSSATLCTESTFQLQAGEKSGEYDEAGFHARLLAMNSQAKLEARQQVRQFIESSKGRRA